MYKIKYPAQFKKDLNLAKKRKLDLELVYEVMDKIETLNEIPVKYKDHPLISNWKGYRELHISSDWLLIYKVDHNKKEIFYARTGTHSDLFK